MPGPLAPYRVLDLTTDRGWLCGRILADLGADVVKVEPPGGDPGRRRGPFAGGTPDPEQSLRWWFQNRGKRSVVLDLACEDGRARLRRLVAGADVVLESFDPGHLDARGLGYADIGHDSLVWTTVTPFGQDGPRASWLGPDLVLAAIGGEMWTHGDPDRPPIRPSVPQFELHGAAEAAAATAIALYHASATGRGQRVDVASLLTVIRTLLTAPAYPVLEDRELRRTGGVNPNGLRLVHKCLDGYSTVIFAPAFGARRMLAWAAKHVAVPAWLSSFDWEGTDFVETVRGDRAKELWDAVGAILTEFCASRTKRELYDEALREGYLIAPVNTLADALADEQLTARGFFREVHGVVQPGPWIRMSATPLRDPERAPRAGEHEVDWEPRRPRVEAQARGDVFEGLKVLDMSWVGVGPMTARYLADHGATVVRLESTKRIDVLRALPPYPGRRPGLNRSQFWADLNASKLGVGVDLTNPQGREVARRLVAWADVALESFTPGTLKGWGLAYEDLRAINPSLVMLSTCMQGQTGPRAHYRGFGQLIASLGGFYAIHGWPDRAPTPLGAYTDTVCQRFACAALVAALDHRRRTGEGQHLDLSQFEAGLQFLGTEMLDLVVNGYCATRKGNADRDAYPHGVYPCAGEDRWVAIAVHTDEQWNALCEIASFAHDDGLCSAALRKAREAEVDDLVAAWTRDRDPHDIVAALQPRVPAGVVQTLGELHTDPQISHLGYFVDVDHVEIGRAPYEDQQARFSLTQPRIRKAAPCLGEDTFDVLTAMLGMSEDEVADLLASEAVEITGGEG